MLLSLGRRTLGRFACEGIARTRKARYALVVKGLAYRSRYGFFRALPTVLRGGSGAMPRGGDKNLEGRFTEIGIGNANRRAL